MSNFLMFLGVITTMVLFNVMVLYRDKPPRETSELGAAPKRLASIATIEPLDFTVTFCEACKKCTHHTTLDLLDFEECADFEK